MTIVHSYVILPEGISIVPSVDHKTRIRWIYPIKSPWYHVPFKTLVWNLICIRFGSSGCIFDLNWNCYPSSLTRPGPKYPLLGALPLASWDDFTGNPPASDSASGWMLCISRFMRSGGAFCYEFNLGNSFLASLTATVEQRGSRCDNI